MTGARSAPPLTFLPTQLKFTLLTKYGKQVASIENARQRVFAIFDREISKSQAGRSTSAEESNCSCR